MCMRNCSHGAIKIDKFLAVVDKEICKECSDPTCLTKCPTGAIGSLTGKTKEEKSA